MGANHRFAPAKLLPGWIWPAALLALAGLAGGAYFFLMNGDEQAQASTDHTSQTPRDAAPQTSRAVSPESGPAVAESFKTGLDVVLEDPEVSASFRGKRLGLITNRASVTRSGKPGWQALQEAKLGTLVSIMTPEHGFLADQEGKGATRVAGFQGKVFGLYGKNLQPTAEMLAGVEVLVFDLQDAGARFYTYLSTMALSLEAAKKAGLSYVVLDRPNPVAPQGSGGGVLEPGIESFVGLLPVPMRHGLTLGEMATYLASTWPGRFGAQLQVVKMQGWRHGLWFDDLGLDWIAPSPSLPDFAAVLSYPGFCLFEGTNLSLGRGTSHPFQLVAAPWLKAEPVAEALKPLAAELGAELVVEKVTPKDPPDKKFAGKVCQAIRVNVRDRSKYEPIRLALALLVEIRRQHPKSFRFLEKHFDRLAGTKDLRTLIDKGKPLTPLTERWHKQLDDFALSSRQAVLYPN